MKKTINGQITGIILSNGKAVNEITDVVHQIDQGDHVEIKFMSKHPVNKNMPSPIILSLSNGNHLRIEILKVESSFIVTAKYEK